MLTKAESIFSEVYTKRFKMEIWREKRRILRFQPSSVSGRVIIVATGSRGVRTRGKVTPRQFFPPFCRVLGQCGIGAVYTSDLESLEREIWQSDGVPTVLVSLVNETFDDLDTYNIPNNLLQLVNAVFNSYEIANIIRDKKEANRFFSKHGISMPSCTLDKNKRTFSNARLGSGERAYIVEDLEHIDRGRYNTQFIDTTIQFQSSAYFTCLRLVCIGTHLVQIYVRARDTNEEEPSVHSKNTPRSRDLLEYLHAQLVLPRLEELFAFSDQLGRILGPGFYAHDVLVDNRSGDLYLSEAGFKFFDETYADRMRGVMVGRNLRYKMLDQEAYAGYAASVFVTYCAQNGFL